MANLRVLEVSRDHAFGALPGVVFYVWRGATTVAAARGIMTHVARIHAEHPTIPCVLMGVVEAGTPPPDSDARKALGESMQKGSAHLRASALAFEGEGFQASMVRAVATGLSLLARTSYPHQVFAGVDQAAGWLSQQVPEHDAATLIAGLQQLRSAPHPS
jgi:hypothetical protein